MHHKEIKRQIRKELKKEFPNWKRLNNKEKKEIARKVLNEVVGSYDFSKKIESSEIELLGLEEQIVTPGILTLDQMEELVKSHNSGILFGINGPKGHPAIRNEELKIIDSLLDDRILNLLLSSEGYTPCKREFFPAMFLRAEILKAIRFPEISYRKFCGDDNDYEGHKRNNPFTGTECKENRAFIGLPLNLGQMISHVQMSQFRSSLTFPQMVNLMVYILCRVRQSGLLGPGGLHCIDSSELAVECQRPLATLKVKGQNIRIYSDIDCDCGVRRNKRDKSTYVVGYRMHTLTAINPETGGSIPLISLLAAANHHDKHFLKPLVALGKAIGLDINLVNADGAYHYNEEERRNDLFSKTGVHVVTPPDPNVKLPENVDAETLQVTFGDHCDIAMEYVGTEGDSHEFKCGDEEGQCLHASICPKYRHIPIDNGSFQRIRHGSQSVEDALNIRKNCERPFNLLKKREGLDNVRVRSQHGLMARIAFTTMATLLLEIAQTRKSKPEKVRQEQMLLPFAA